MSSLLEDPHASRRPWNPWLWLTLTSCVLACSSKPQQKEVAPPPAVQFLGATVISKDAFQVTAVGGLSALAYDRHRGVFLALSDDRAERAQTRFYSLNITVTRDASGHLVPQAVPSGMTFLKQGNEEPFARDTLDPEGLTTWGEDRVIVSSEGITHLNVPPRIMWFARSTGVMTGEIVLPPHVIPDAPAELQTKGVRDNAGFEGLSMCPGEQTLLAAVESPLKQDGEPNSGKTRILRFHMDPQGPVLRAEYVYPLSPPDPGTLVHGVTTLLCLPCRAAGCATPDKLLVLERGWGAAVGFFIRLFLAEVGQATNVMALHSLVGHDDVVMMKKTLLLDLASTGEKLDNLEGLALGPVLPDGRSSLLIMADDNFKDDQVNQLLLFALPPL